MMLLRHLSLYVHARINDSNVECVPAEHDVVTPDGDAHVRINDSPMTDVECSDSDHYTYQLPDDTTPDGAAHARINDSDVSAEYDVVTPDGDALLPLLTVLHTPE